MFLNQAVQQRLFDAHSRVELLFKTGKLKTFARGVVISGVGAAEDFPLLYVKKGLVRHASGVELKQTHWLTCEGEFAVLSTADYAPRMLVAEETVQALAFTADALEEACARHYEVERFRRLLVDTHRMMQSFHAFVVKRPPLERCIHFRRYFPEWVQRIPHTLIAELLQIDLAELEQLCAASMAAASTEHSGIPEPVFYFPWENEMPGAC